MIVVSERSWRNRHGQRHGADTQTIHLHRLIVVVRSTPAALLHLGISPRFREPSWRNPPQYERVSLLQRSCCLQKFNTSDVANALKR